MTTALQNAYRTNRRKGYPARVALQAARAEERPLEWDWNGERAELERDGFTLALTAEPDPYGAELDWLGDFTDDDDDETVEHPLWNGDSRTYRRFRPTYSIADRITDNRRAGMTKDAARADALESASKDARMAATLTDYIVTVTASRAGVELGSATLGGCSVAEDDYGDTARRYFEETAGELTDEAIEQARATLAKLCEAAV